MTFCPRLGTQRRRRGRKARRWPPPPGSFVHFSVVPEAKAAGMVGEEEEEERAVLEEARPEEGEASTAACSQCELEAAQGLVGLWSSTSGKSTSLDGL